MLLNIVALIDLTDHAERFGVAFRNEALLREALTHRSFLNEHPEAQVPDNERLEYLGDAILAFLAGEWLFRQLPTAAEGLLTRLRAGLVRNQTLAQFARSLTLGKSMLFSRGEDEQGGRERDSNLGSAFEAFIGALYLDQGIDRVRELVVTFWEPLLKTMIAEQTDKDFKSQLQELAHRLWGVNPTYNTVEVTGPDHARKFTIEVLIGETPYAQGRGRSKQVAAQQAAAKALETLQQQGLTAP